MVLADLAYKPKSMTWSFSGNTTKGVLTVSNRNQSVGLNLLGDYTRSTWTLSKDASGGTLVVDPIAAQSTSPPVASDPLEHAMWAHSALGFAGHTATSS